MFLGDGELFRGLAPPWIGFEHDEWKTPQSRLKRPTAARSVPARPPPAKAEIERLPGLLDDAPKSENEARRALSLLSQVLNQLPVALTVQSDDGTMLLANERANALYGGETEDAEEAAVPAASATDDGVSVAEDRVAGPNGERTLLTYRKSARILDRTAVAVGHDRLHRTQDHRDRTVEARLPGPSDRFAQSNADPGAR